MFITPCLFKTSNILTSSFLTPVCPAFWLAIKRSSLSNKALGSLGRIMVFLRPSPSYKPKCSNTLLLKSPSSPFIYSEQKV